MTKRQWAFGAASIGLLGYIGAAVAQTALGPSMTTLTGTGVAQMAALAANPTRKGVTICNEHASNTVTFTLGTTLTPVSTTTGRVLAAGNLVTSCWTIGSTQGLSNAGTNVGAQINVISSTISTPITFIEYY
jgi:hypothetical protein